MFMPLGSVTLSPINSIYSIHPSNLNLTLKFVLISGHYQIWCSRDIGSICALGLTLLLNTL